MRTSTLCFRSAVVLLAAGMVWGLQMAISNDHQAFPAHAHLNLLGFVALFMFGFFYRLHPAIEALPLARVQAFVWIGATVIMAIGVGLVHTGNGGEAIAAVGSVVIFLDLLLFGYLVFKADA